MENLLDIVNAMDLKGGAISRTVPSASDMPKVDCGDDGDNCDCYNGGGSSDCYCTDCSNCE